MKTIRILLLALALAACATPAPQARTSDLTILVSIDGFRADYLDAGATPTLSRLAAEGARAAMRPSFPTLTFPNHYTLVTGLTPDHSGLVGNVMEDAARPGVTFTMGNLAVASDPLWWDGAEPLWVTAERQGVPTATMFWPGSDYAIRGVRPGRWRAFDQTLSGFARVDQLLGWLDGPSATQPRFATLYFDIVDTAGHRYGAVAPETMSAAAEVDAAMARLVAGLRARGRQANLVIVADHGMADVAGDRLIDLDAMAGPGVIRVVSDGPLAAIVPLAGQAADAERALLGRGAHGECWRKSEMPARFGFGRHARAAPILCLADVGWRYRSAQIPPYSGPTRGAHGYDPDAPEMAAVFIAHGPAFRPGVALASFPNVSVYPLLAKLIGVAPEPNDGVLADTAPALAADFGQ